MIHITQKTDCCGCSACQQICPKRCISLKMDIEGFWYPEIDVEACIDCNKCQMVCPVLHQDEERPPLLVYAASNKSDEVRLKSASGGIFSVIAEKAINRGGFVFGVKFDTNYDVIFGYTNKAIEIDHFRRSKYVQAWLGDTYSTVAELLKQNKLVVFTGTPCQIAGLRHYLVKDYENLILVDLICEGVPSPKVWKRYLAEEKQRLIRKKLKGANPDDCIIDNVSFRNKENGWKHFSFSMDIIDKVNLSRQYHYVNRYSSYLQSVTNKMTLRPICYQCPFKSGKSHSDITIADYWGINKLHPEIHDDDKGLSMVYINTPKGKDFLDMGKLYYVETSYKEAFKYNNIVSSVNRHPNREKFFKEIDVANDIITLLYHNTFTIQMRIRILIKTFLGARLTRKIQSLLIFLRELNK